MIWKTFFFFLTTFITLAYLSIFFENRDKKVKIHFFGQEIETRLSTLILTIFLDGAILTSLFLWLLK